ncbi:MAG: hypothetical protein WEA04_03010 [Candidatus Andersenbacteria bacterium]
MTAYQKELALVIFVCSYSLLPFAAMMLLLPLSLQHGWYALVIILLALVWIMLMALCLSILRRPASLAALYLVPALMVVAFSILSPVGIGAAVLLVVFMAMAQRTIVREVHNRVYYRITQIFPGGVQLLTLGLMIALLGVAWPLITNSVAQARFQITERQIEPLLKPFDPIINDFFPGYTPQTSFDELLEASIAEERKKLPPGYIIDEQQLQRSRQEIAQRLGQNLSGQESFSTIVAGLINRQINELTSQNPLIASILLMIIIFLTFRVLVPFIVWPTLGLIALSVQLGQEAQLFTITRTQAMVERLQL